MMQTADYIEKWRKTKEMQLRKPHSEANWQHATLGFHVESLFVSVERQCKRIQK